MTGIAFIHSECMFVSQVSVLCHLFTESRSDYQQREVLGHIKDYNKRYSGAPRRVSANAMLQYVHSGLIKTTPPSFIN